MVYDADEYEWNGPTQHISAELIGKAKAWREFSYVEGKYTRDNCK